MTEQILLAVLSLIVTVGVAYFTASYAVRRDYRFGRVRMLELCRRYMINFFNSFEGGKIKTGSLDHLMYVRELEVIVREFEDLANNPYFGRLAAHYSSVSMLLVQIRRELIEQQSRQALGSMNPGSFKAIHDLFSSLRNDMPGRYANTHVDQFIDDTARTLSDRGVLALVSRSTETPRLDAE